MIKLLNKKIGLLTLVIVMAFVMLSSHAVHADQWMESEDGDTMYVLDDGSAITGLQVIDGKTYYFNEAGIMQTGLVNVGGVKYYFNSDGEAKSGFVTSGKNTYYSDASGKLQSGWVKNKNNIYYFDKSSLKMAKGWTKIDEKKYYFDSDGKALSGWQEIDGKKYYLGKRGKQFTGFKKIEKKRYYLLKDGGLQTGWMKKGKNKYFFDDNGVLATGWKNLNGVKYYFYKPNNKAGKPIGAMAKNTTIDGKELDKKGRWVGSTPDGMDKKAAGQSSATNYLILVNCNIHYVAIYKGSQGAWTPIYKWQCADGAAGTPTVKGSFTTAQKGYYFDKFGVRCFYYTQFYGDYLFHSVLCNENGDVVDGRVGMGLSHGCVRLAKENAKWIYDNIPTGTKVVVY